MKNKKVTVFVESIGRKKGFNCFVKETLPCGLIGVGNSAKEAIEDLHSSEKEVREAFAEEGKEFPVLVYSYEFDFASFFSYYDFIKIEGVAKCAGINPSLMRQYIMGIAKPSPQRLQHINNTIAEMTKQLSTASISSLATE